MTRRPRGVPARPSFALSLSVRERGWVHVPGYRATCPGAAGSPAARGLLPGQDAELFRHNDECGSGSARFSAPLLFLQNVSRLLKTWRAGLDPAWQVTGVFSTRQLRRCLQVYALEYDNVRLAYTPPACVFKCKLSFNPIGIAHVLVRMPSSVRPPPAVHPHIILPNSQGAVRIRQNQHRPLLARSPIRLRSFRSYRRRRVPVDPRLLEPSPLCQPLTRFQRGYTRRLTARQGLGSQTSSPSP